ncbi:polyketide cyclase [Roseomonas terrae]|jgi:uncharacterized protein YndB with AHSA1/START domain|uniref:Polyketide cyclase n=1 Tax=Neoroseomonas terrae TaxID=424799 RepID=A0ABS5EKI9_9PROT|nr:SRPBCC domain-containing protein [Neoroseomonas terrae]MBR0651532.1 polyketide cyclase [Neoroseomonas terrae]
MTGVSHRTFVFERQTGAEPERVFAAYADPAERQAWSAPSDTAMFAYETADFTEGGVDTFRCGSKEAPQYAGRTTYLSIVPSERIVTAEVIHAGGRTVMTCLNTVELVAQGSGTRILATVQVASFIGDAMLDGVREGNEASLNNLVRHLAG